MNKTFNLFKQKYINYNSAMSTIYLYSITGGLFLIFSSYWTLEYASNEFEPSSAWTFIFVSMNTFLVSIIAIFLTISIFKKDFDNKKIVLEQRYGYNTRQIFVSRLITSLIVFIQVLLFIVVVNLSFAFIININSIIVYKMYIVSIGWYAIIFILVYSLTLFFITVLSDLVSLLLSIVITLFFITFSTLSFSILDKIEVNNDNPDLMQKLELSIALNDNANNIYEIMKKSDSKKELLKISNQFLEWNNFTIERNRLFNVPDDYHWSNKYLTYFGTDFWSDEIYELEQYQDIIDFYVYFNKFFQVNLEQYNDAYINFKYGNFFSLYSSNRLEPIDFILKDMSDLVDYKYQGFIKKLYKYQIDNYLSDVYEDYSLTDEHLTIWLEDYILNNNINNSKIIFFKMFEILMDEIIDESSLLKNEYFNNASAKWNKNLIFNPILHFGQMFNGINYKQNLNHNKYISSSEIGYGYINYKLDYYEINGIIYSKIDRATYPEIIYLFYSIIGFLIIFVNFFLFKKLILK